MSTDASAPHTVIEPHEGWRGIDWAELWKYRELLYFFAWRDIKIRYKQTVLGAAWAIIQPVMTMIVFSIFFGKLGGLDRNVDIPYPIFVYAGILPWTFFASGVGQSATSLIGSQNLITKVYFPRAIVPSSAIIAALVDFAVALGVMFALMAWYQTTPSWFVLFLPFLVLGLLMAAIGVGTLMAALVVQYRDFRYVVPFMLQIWFFASPIAYPLDRVDELAEYLPNVNLRLLYSLNPLAGLIQGFRAALLGEPVEVGCIAVSLGSSLLLLIVGMIYFARVERQLSDIV
ncbi:MAG TPA: ABC transporter permease [Pirellulales bacterium]|jgi:lipopolysaccharide transport system permease protein|nr:ABC transporter permease [Pirellulales bacterium]